MIEEKPLDESGHYHSGPEDRYTYYDSGETMMLKTLRENGPKTTRQSHTDSYLEPGEVQKMKPAGMVKAKDYKETANSEQTKDVELRSEDKSSRKSHTSSYLSPTDISLEVGSCDQFPTKADEKLRSCDQAFGDTVYYEMT